MIFLSFITRPVLNTIGFGALASWVTVKEALVEARMGSLFGHRMTYIDEYLKAWLYATEIENRIIGALWKEEHVCRAHLVKAFRREEPGAIPRLVLLMVVQGGGSVLQSSELGIELQKVVGRDFPIAQLQRGPSYFAHDLCLWYLKNQNDYPRFMWLDRWLKSDFANRTMIPAYEQMQRD